MAVFNSVTCNWLHMQIHLPNTEDDKGFGKLPLVVKHGSVTTTSTRISCSSEGLIPWSDLCCTPVPVFTGWMFIQEINCP